MTKQPSISPPCRSVFRENAAAPTKEIYTNLWTTLINQMERSKKILAGAK